MNLWRKIVRKKLNAKVMCFYSRVETNEAIFDKRTCKYYPQVIYGMVSLIALAIVNSLQI